MVRGWVVNPRTESRCFLRKQPFWGNWKVLFSTRTPPQDYRAVKEASYTVTKTKPEQNKSKQTNKQTNKMQTKKWGWRKSNPDLCHKKKKEKRKNRQTNNCWFSHDVTKKFKPQLSILRRFYFHGVLEQLKTNFQTNCRFRRTLGFVIEYAWISKLLRDTAFTWRPRELSCRLKKLLC